MMMKTRNKGCLIVLIMISHMLIGCPAHTESPGDRPAQEAAVHEFKAFNGIRFEYSLLLPTDYDEDRTYEIIAILCEVSRGQNAWAATVRQLATIDLQRSIILIPKVPIGEENWGTHPIHHAFNDLLKSVRKSYGKPDQQFHLVGLEAGHETAFWWTNASRELIASTAIVNGHLWKEKRWDRRWYGNLVRSEVAIYVYEEGPVGQFEMPAFTFKQPVNLEGVIEDIEKRGQTSP